MTLRQSDRLGPYEILEPIGRGGMGEVYRVRDTRLGREVAVKVSAEKFGERFEREARAVASLNHPNVCTLHDVGPNYLVMELVEGPTLAERIKAGPIPLEEAIPIARQIADALEAAHDKGVTHRDLKPGNIKIKPDGTVKVLDFGLAKVGLGANTVSPDDSPTVSLQATQAGMILGTPGYMSPEQAKGKTADRRCDIWSFGVVLYEMLTGKSLFTGETTGEVLASVIRDEPNLDALGEQIRPLLARCLTKDPKRRLQAIGEARLILEDPSAFAPPAVRPSVRARPLPWIAAAAFLMAAIAFAVLYFGQTPPQQRTIRFQISPPGTGNAAAYKLSPDGRYLAFTALEGGRVRLFVRAMDSLETRVIPGTEGVRFPFWAPDSASIGFFHDAKLKRVSVDGGPAQTLCPAAQGLGGTWNQDGIIVFQPGPGNGTPIMRVLEAGGEPVAVTNVAANEGHVFPEFLPDGQHFLYWKRAAPQNTPGIYAGSLDGRPPVRVLADESTVAYVAPATPGKSGHILFRREGALMAQPFDPNTLNLSDDVFPVADNVGTAGAQGYGAFSASQNGTLVYSSGGDDGLRGLPVWTDRTGKPLGQAGPPGTYANLSLSRDGRSIAFNRFDSNNTDVFVREIARNVTRRLTFDPDVETIPTWSPDSLRVLFLKNQGGLFDLYTRAASGAGQEELLAKVSIPQGLLGLTDWSLDGQFILYTATTANGTARDIWALPLSGDKKPFPYLHELYNEFDPAISPDGSWVAYVSNESGHNEVYVQSFPASGGKWQISSNDGGSDPLWNPDGTELFYVRLSDQSLVAVPVKTRSSFVPGTPMALFPLPSIGNRRNYAVADKGQRFLVATSTNDAGQPITVVINWQAGLVKP